jgi:hypothetical protein
MHIDWLVLCNKAHIDFVNNLVDIEGAGADNAVTDGPLPARIKLEFVVRLIGLPDTLDPHTHLLDMEVRDPDDNVVQLRDPNGGPSVDRATLTAESHGVFPPGRRTLLVSEPIEFDASQRGRFRIVALADGGQTVTASLYVM